VNRVEVIGVEGIGEVVPGDDLAGLIAAAAELRDGDVVVVTQKIVSKSWSKPRPCASSDAAATW